MECVDLVPGSGMRSQAMAALTQLEVQLLADKIMTEVFSFGQKIVCRRKLIEIVTDELQKMGVLLRDCPQT